jgi:hypothetical protein
MELLELYIFVEMPFTEDNEIFYVTLIYVHFYVLSLNIIQMHIVRTYLTSIIFVKIYNIVNLYKKQHL